MTLLDESDAALFDEPPAAFIPTPDNTVGLPVPVYDATETATLCARFHANGGGGGGGRRPPIAARYNNGFPFEIDLALHDDQLLLPSLDSVLFPPFISTIIVVPSYLH